MSDISKQDYARCSTHDKMALRTAFIEASRFQQQFGLDQELTGVVDKAGLIDVLKALGLYSSQNHANISDTFDLLDYDKTGYLNW